MAEHTPDSIITTQRNGQTIVAELFFNHSSTETFRDKLLKGRFLFENPHFPQVKSREKHPKNAPIA